MSESTQSYNLIERYSMKQFPIKFSSYKEKTTIVNGLIKATYDTDDVIEGVCHTVRTTLEEDGEAFCNKCSRKSCIVNYPFIPK